MNQMQKTYFKLFACCIPVLGAKKSIICDLQRNSYCEIPNAMYHILTQYQNESFSELTDIFEDQETLIEYFDFLKKNEFGFWTETPEKFPELSRNWDHPSLITNAIIDVNDHSNHNFKKIFLELEIVGCTDLQIRFFNSVVTCDTLEAILKHTQNSKVACIDIIIPFQQHFSREWLCGFCVKFQRINRISVYNYPEENLFKVYEGDPKELYAQVVFTPQIIESDAHCGIIDPYYFIADTEGFMESMQFNSCLNRKVGIDVSGEIRNCPSMKTSFGNIRATSIEEVIVKEQFKELWLINKDKIKVCQDCEFRHICTDCRAFITEENDLFSKPSKFGYDPYSGTWESKSEISDQLETQKVS